MNVLRASLLAGLLAVSACSHGSSSSSTPPAPPPAPVAAPPAASASAPVGYAASVTGGSTLCTFSDLTSLRTCVAKPGTLAEPSGPLTIDPGAQRIVVAARVTLNGLGLLTINADSYGLDLTGSNAIVRNTYFAGPGPQKTVAPASFPNANCTGATTPDPLLGCAVPIEIEAGITGVWIDHDDFSHCGDKCVSGYQAFGVTISNSRFSDSFFGVLMLGRDMTKPPGQLTLTGDEFDGVFRRQARVSGAFVMHEFANLITGQCPKYAGGGFGPSAVGTAQLLAEDNVVDPGACGAVNVSDYDNAKTEVKLGPGIALARGNSGLADVAGAITFTPPYAYSLPDGATVRASVLANAGVQTQ